MKENSDSIGRNSSVMFERPECQLRHVWMDEERGAVTDANWPDASQKLDHRGHIRNGCPDIALGET
jgi:hypothetical protein